jgi:hypothetical protein
LEGLLQIVSLRALVVEDGESGLGWPGATVTDSDDGIGGGGVNVVAKNSPMAATTVLRRSID